MQNYSCRFLKKKKLKIYLEGFDGINPGGIHNPVKHLGWSFLQKQLTAENC